mgnify:FL=1
MAEPPTPDRAPSSLPTHPGEAMPARSDGTPSAAVRGRYEVVSVEPVAVPDGGQGTDWCRYVLVSGTSRITGLHRGTVDEVTAFAASSADDFNHRSAHGKGKAGAAYARKQPPIPVAR